jgi:hypothetical protein
MPEIKHNFTGGKMNKDLDERLVPNGEYRDAMNVQVTTSEGSDVGTVQNLLSNHKIYGNELSVRDGSVCIGSIADEKNNAVYWFLKNNETLNPNDLVFADDPTILIELHHGFILPLMTGDSIIEFKEDNTPQIHPVVVEASAAILPLVGHEGITTLNNAGGTYQQDYFHMPGLESNFLQPGMQLVEVYVIDSASYTIPGSPATILSTLDFSGVTTPIPYTDVFGVSQNSNVPPQISVYDPGDFGDPSSFTLDFTPTDLLNLLPYNPINTILAFRFESTAETRVNNPLNFQENTIITGINIIDDMLFWTDNYNEPKKVNIPRCKEGTTLITYPGYTGPSSYGYTRLINKKIGASINNNIPLREKHVTVIRKAPSLAPVLDLKLGRDYSGISDAIPKVYTGVVKVGLDTGGIQTDDIITTSNIYNTNPYDFSGVSVGDEVTLQIPEDIHGNNTFQLLWGITASDAIGKTIVLKEFDGDNSEPPPTPITDYRIKGDIVHTASLISTPGSPVLIKIIITSIDGFPPGPVYDVSDPAIETFRLYAIDLFDPQEKLFEFKFPRFATRYKYSDGEYSAFSPFTEVAFVPGSFDYHPKKGYNLGMTNRVTEIHISNFRLNDIPLDVVAIDILYKEDTSPNVYIVDTIKSNLKWGFGPNNWWFDDVYKITHETIKAAVPSNQLLRPWDNVPRKALAQEISGNRIIYGNYRQGWDLVRHGILDWQPDFNWDIIHDDSMLAWNTVGQTDAVKSIKSLREYQLGVVFIDKYGRETPVISNPTGTFELDHTAAPKHNRIKVGFNGSPPIDQHYYKFYIKQTSGEYYNLAMDRWFDAADGNIWLSFPSSDRNKLDIDTFLILKKAADSNEAVTDKARYKVLAIENEAPDFVKTKVTKIRTGRHISDPSPGVIGPDEIFSDDLTTLPLSGSDSFEIYYNPFIMTTGSKLHEIDDGDLYVSFGLQGSVHTSKRYRITSITTDYIDPTTVEDPAWAPGNPKYFLQLDEFLDDDVNFITNDPTGNVITNIQDNTIINIYKHKVENLPIFDGKFFVKIYLDDSFKKFISKGYPANSLLEWRRVAERKVYSMRYNHKKLHSIQATGHGLKNAFYANTNAESAYSQEFGRYASYFRLYNYGNSDWDWGDAMPTGGWTYWSNRYRFHSPNNSPGPFDINAIKNTPWTKEFYYYTGWGAFDSGQATGVYGDNASDNYLALNKPADGSNQEPTARDNEVWFIDMGEYKHSHTIYAQPMHLDWKFVNDNPGTASQTNPASSYPAWNGSLYHDTGSANWHHFSISFGPCFEAKSIHNNSPSAPANIFNDSMPWSVDIKDLFGIGTTNPNYQDSSTTNFTNQLQAGSTWRWREDPMSTRFTLDSNIKIAKRLRYWAGDNPGLLPGATYADSSGLREMHAATGNFPVTDTGSSSGGCFNAGQLSPNFNVRWKWMQTHQEQPGKLDWIPYDLNNALNPVSTGSSNQDDIGPISGGREFIVQCAWMASGEPYGNNVAPGAAGGDGVNSTGIDEFFIYIAEDSFNGSIPSEAEDQYGNYTAVAPGYIVKQYTDPGGSPVELTGEVFTTVNGNSGGIASPYLVVRGVSNVIELAGQTGKVRKVYLTGYVEALDLAHVITPDNGAKVTFVQPTMNGYSPNSAARISIQKSTTGLGAYTVNTSTGCTGFNENLLYAVGYTMEFIEQYYDNEGLVEDPAIWETEPKDGPELDIYYEASGLIPLTINADTDSGFLPLQDETEYGILRGSIKNCIIRSSPSNSQVQFPDGTEIIDINGQGHLTVSNDNLISSPILPFINEIVHITKPDGTIFTTYVDLAPATNEIIIASSTWAGTSHSLNWHNCYSFSNGVESNRIRDNFNLPFIANGVKASSTLEEKIKEDNRQYGLIFSGIYNAISSTNNLNQFIAAENITKEINPIYGSIQKLHSRSTADGDLIALCEDRVLKILATKDALYNADGQPELTATENVLGQTIPFAGEYGISKNPESFASESYRSYFSDKQRGTIMRLSQDGLTPISDHGMKDWFRDNLRINNRIIGSYDEKKDEYNVALKTTSYQGSASNHVVSFREDVKGWVSFKSFVEMESGVSMAGNYYTFSAGEIYQHHSENTGGDPPFNTFYDNSTPSSITVLLNDDPSTVKSFKTLAYEGSQAKITQDLTDSEYYNLQNQHGWWLYNINTDMENGQQLEFLRKENKWFNYIKGVELGMLDDTDDFAYQGLGEIIPTQLQVSSSTIGVINNINYEMNYSLQVGDVLHLSYINTITGGFSVYGTVEVLGQVTQIFDNYIVFDYATVGNTQAWLESAINASNPSYFISFRKEAAVNRNSLKGYFALGQFMNNDFLNKNELFVVNSQIAPSSK